MKQSVVHPPPAELASFALGRLDAAAAQTVANHIETCAECRDFATTVPHDSLLELLQSAHRKPAKPALDVTPSLMDDGTQPGPGLNTQRLEELPAELVDHPRYRVLRKLGDGGMGTVFLAEHRIMGRRVALKVMNKGMTSRPEAIERFIREIKAVASLDHPNIGRAYDAERAGDLHLFAMEYLEGADLSKVVTERGPLPVTDACDYIRQAALGLQHASDHGIVHRDIKPHNLMLTPNGTVKVLDFGLTRLRGQESEMGLTAENAVMGTPLYFSPEQANDAQRADARSDIYSLGCTLYFLLTGKPPFRGTLTEILVAHLREAPEEIHPSRRDVPPELDALIARMMAKAPTDRPQTHAEVANLLAPFAVPEAEPITPSQPAEAPRRRSIAKVAGIGVGLGLIAVLLMAVAGVFKVKTKDGTIVLENLPQEAEVLVNNEVVTVIWPGGDKAAEIRVKPGEPKLEVRLDGVKVFTTQVTLEPEGRAPIAVRLELPEEAIVEPKEEPTTAELPKEGYPAAAKELLKNPGCEEGTGPGIKGWVEVQGRWRAGGGDRLTPVFEGKSYFHTVKNQRGELAQDVDVSAYADLIDAGKQQFKFLGYVRSYDQETPDLTRIIVEYRDKADGRKLAEFDSGLSKNVKFWKPLRDTRTAPKGTRVIRVRLISIRAMGENNNGYFDGLSLQALPQPKPPVQYGQELLRNAGCEEPMVASRIPGWTHVKGGWRRGTGTGKSAFEGEAFFQTYKSAQGELQQDVDVSTMASRIDAGKQEFEFKGYARSSQQNNPDVTRMYVEYRDAANAKILTQFASEPASTINSWKPISDKRIAPPGTRWIRVRMVATSTHAENNDAIMDGLSLRALESLPPQPQTVSADAIREGRVKAPDLSKARVRFSDEFDDYKTGWPLLLGDIHGYRNPGAGQWPAPVAKPPGKGRWFMRRTARGGASIRSPWSGGNDPVVEVVGRSLGDADNFWGVELNNSELKHGIGVYLNGRGQVRIRRTYAGEGKDRFPAPHAEDITHSAIKKGEEFNTLLVVARGRTVEVYVNGVAVFLPLTVEFDYFPAAMHLAMHTLTKGEAEFERVAIYAADNLSMLGDRVDLAASEPKPPLPTDPIREGRVKAPDLGGAKVLYAEEFEDLVAGWPAMLRAGPKIIGYRDKDTTAWPAPVPLPPNRPKPGRLFIRRTDPGFEAVTSAKPWKGADCAVEAVGRTLGDPENYWGVELNNNDAKRGVGVYLNGRGEVRLHPTYTQFAGRFPQPHGDHIPHPAIKKGEEFNTLLVVSRGRQVEVYVNGVAVCTPLTTDFDYLPGQLHLFMATKTKGEAEFERIHIYSAEKLPKLSDQLVNAQQNPAAVAGNFEPLFNGQDLDGWVVDGGDKERWQVKDGELEATGTGHRNGVALLTERDYADFNMRFEFQIAPGGIAAMCLRAHPGERSGTAYPYPTKIQITGDSKVNWPTGAFEWSTTGVQALIPEKRPELKPFGEWNNMEVESAGKMLKITVNGKELHKVDISQYANQTDAQMGLKRSAGRIGFYSHTGKLRLRNIEVRELAQPNAQVGVERGTMESLFNGKDFTGWYLTNGPSSNWRVENGELIAAGKDVRTQGHLLTAREFTDYRLRLEFRLVGAAHSSFTVRGGGDWVRNCFVQPGIAITTETYDNQPGLGGFWWLKDVEGSRGVLPPKVRPTLAASDDWNTLEVEVLGQHLRATINGKEVQNLSLAEQAQKPNALSALARTTAPIGFFQHTGEVRFRNIQIEELQPPEPKFVSIFNGKDLTGWTVESGEKGAWKVENGELRAKGDAPSPKGYLTQGYILSDKDYSDYTLRFEFKLFDLKKVDTHSGVALRAVPNEKTPQGYAHHLTILLGRYPGPKEWTGTLWWAQNSIAQPNLPTLVVPPLRRDGQWNEMEVEMRGQHLRIKLNGAELQNVHLDKVGKLKGPSPGLSRTSGRIGFMERTGPAHFRNIRIMEHAPAKAEESKGKP